MFIFMFSNSDDSKSASLFHLSLFYVCFMCLCVLLMDFASEINDDDSDD